MLRRPRPGQGQGRGPPEGPARPGTGNGVPLCDLELEFLFSKAALRQSTFPYVYGDVCIRREVKASGDAESTPPLLSSPKGLPGPVYRQRPCEEGDVSTVSIGGHILGGAWEGVCPGWGCAGSWARRGQRESGFNNGQCNNVTMKQ